MLFVGLDKDGSQHCVRCGGQAFTNERETRVAEVLGVQATLTRPVLALRPAAASSTRSEARWSTRSPAAHGRCSVVARPMTVARNWGTPWW